MGGSGADQIYGGAGRSFTYAGSGTDTLETGAVAFRHELRRPGVWNVAGSLKAWLGRS